MPPRQTVTRPELLDAMASAAEPLPPAVTRLNELGAQLDDLNQTVANLQAAIDAERARAEEAEQTAVAAVSAEADRAQRAETLLQPIASAVTSVNGETGPVVVPAITARVALVTLPALAIGTPPPITVKWPTPMPTATYGVLLTFSLPTGSLGQLNGTVIPGSVTASGCQVALKAVIAVAAGAQLVAVALTQ